MKISKLNYFQNVKAFPLKQNIKFNGKETPGFMESNGVSSFSYGYNSLKMPFDAREFLKEIRTENPQCEYFDERGHRITRNCNAIKKLRVLENLSLVEKKDFIQCYCEETGFPKLEKVKENAEKEIVSQIHSLAKQHDFDVSFIAYDKNCSIGRQLALPGSDCDALFMIIDTKAHDEPWFPGFIRWNFKDDINQRILVTPAKNLPEVLSLQDIEDGINIANEAFEKADFSLNDLKRFSSNLKDTTNDFVSSAEFNIRLAEQMPEDEQIRTMYYKSAMLVELYRDGVILENNLSSDFVKKIKESPLYKYSNLIKQQGLSELKKEKYIQREKMVKAFPKMTIDEQFSIVRDMIYSSFSLSIIENKQYFLNTNSSGKDEMGNIVQMYNQILTNKCKQ